MCIAFKNILIIVYSSVKCNWGHTNYKFVTKACPYIMDLSLIILGMCTQQMTFGHLRLMMLTRGTKSAFNLWLTPYARVRGSNRVCKFLRRGREDDVSMGICDISVLSWRSAIHWRMVLTTTIYFVVKLKITDE